MNTSIETTPRLIAFSTIGNKSQGYLSIAQAEAHVPFAVRRIFWTYFTPQSVTRGRHAHHHTEMVLIAVHGRIRVQTENAAGEKQEFLLDSPEKGVYMPPYTWHVMEYSHDAVQVVLASTDYDPDDYIRNYREFKSIVKQLGTAL
jgi:dTDP-4-dehydrorhamnose 3,5-epimerase-like enzyme